MGELEDKINSILSSPEEMERIMQLAQSFMPSGEPESARVETPPAGGLDPEMMSVLTKIMGQMNSASDKSELVPAMTPFIGEERGKRLARAAQTARLIKAARLMFSGRGGDDR